MLFAGGKGGKKPMRSPCGGGVMYYAGKGIRLEVACSGKGGKKSVFPLQERGEIRGSV